MKTINRLIKKGIFLAVGMLCVFIPSRAQQQSTLVIPPFKQVDGRLPQYALKTDRLFHTDQEIAAARANVTSYTGAKRIADSVISAANYWLDWEDQDIIDLMASAEVPRAFDLNAKGCPIHGAAVFKKGGAYPWIVDPKHPFQVKSPIDGRVFPSNDYATYYKSGFKEKKHWDTEYVDDGWGWVAPDGERYWFVAYANHWMWRSHIIPGILNLARAYQLTGDTRYAHKSTLMLHRLAEVYPSMNHEEQSRYGLMMKARNSVYRGKIVNAIWETFLVLAGAEAYDAIWDSIDGNLALQAQLGKTGEQIRAYIEANYLEEALRAFEENKVLGNFGMHQSAVLAVVLARQYADPDKYMKIILENPGEVRSKMGLYYALYNQVFRDGFPLESPEYNFLWVRCLTILASLLQKQGIDLYSLPKFKRLLDAPIQSVAIGRYTPALGDGSDVLGSVTGRDAETYQLAYAALGDSTYLAWVNRPENAYFTTYESLFRNAAASHGSDRADRLLPPVKSRLFAGYGLAVLNNRTDETALAIKYGMHYAHCHWDFLNFELFANGQKMMPDLGYPDAMNNYVREVYTWSQNTVSHNTVVVDERRQNTNQPGRLHHFSVGDFAQSIDAESAAYRQVNQYRRNMILVSVDEGNSYVVDFFHIQGGNQHDYALHGPPGEVNLTQGNWGKVQPGTLAGPDVQLGEIYDNRLLEEKGDSLGYNGYGGSGYQHLFNVQQLERGNPIVAFKHSKDTSSQLRIHVLPFDGQQVFIADAYDKPRAKNHTLKYLITRRESQDSKPLASTFVGVFETFKDQPFIAGVEQLTLNSGNGVAITVSHDKGLDVVIRDTTNAVKILAPYGIKTDANTAVVTFDSNRDLLRVYYTDGTFLEVGSSRFENKPIEGKVRQVDLEANELLVELGPGVPNIAEEPLSGAVHFKNEYRTTVHPAIAFADSGNFVRLKLEDDILVGYFGVAGVDDVHVTADAELNFHHHYPGTALLNNMHEFIGRVVKAGKKHIDHEPGASPLKIGDKVWLANVWNDDTVMVKPAFSWQRNR